MIKKDKRGPALREIINIKLISNTMTDDFALREIYNLMFCSECIKHYKEHINLYRNQKKDFIDWFLYVHNQVNLVNGRSTWTRQQYEKKLLTYIGS